MNLLFPWDEILPLLLFTFSMTFSPGPSNLMMLSSGLHFGIKRSMPIYFGICIGFSVIMFVAALSLGAVFNQYIWLKDGLRIIGVIYLLYLAKQILATSLENKSSSDFKPFSFIQAFLMQWLNPKIWLVAVSAVSIFSVKSHFLITASTIGSASFLMCLLSAAFWLVFGNSLQRLLKNERVRKIFNSVMAFSLVCCIGLLFI